MSKSQVDYMLRIVGDNLEKLRPLRKVMGVHILTCRHEDRKEVRGFVDEITNVLVSLESLHAEITAEQEEGP